MESKVQFCLCVNNKHMSKILSDKGLVERKSLILNFPKPYAILEKYMRDLIRGYFDGDGCIYFKLNNNESNRKCKYDCSFYLLGTEDFLIPIKEYFLSNGIKKISLKQVSNKTIWKLRTSNIKDIIQIRKLLYENCNPNLYLKRKNEKFEIIENYYNNVIHKKDKI